MERRTLISEAKTIAARNVPEDVDAICLAWAAERGVLTVEIFHVNPLTGDDEDALEQFMGELAAAFPEIRVILDEYFPTEQFSEDAGSLVYFRSPR